MIHNNINEFIALKPSAYRFLKSFSLTREISFEGSSDYELELNLVKLENDGNVACLQLRFKGVKDINIGQLNGMIGLFIDIEDIGDRQLEGATFHVLEREYSTFSFYCTDFYVFTE